MKKSDCEFYNEVISYYNGKVIIQAGSGQLHYYEMPEEHVTIGEHFDADSLPSVDSLPPMERMAIINYIRNNAEV